MEKARLMVGLCFRRRAVSRNLGRGCVSWRSAESMFRRSASPGCCGHPPGVTGLVIFVRCSGSSQHSPEVVTHHAQWFDPHFSAGESDGERSAMSG